MNNRFTSPFMAKSPLKSRKGNKGWPTKEYLQGKYENYMGYGSENPFITPMKK